MSIVANLDQLRGRVLRLRQKRETARWAEDVGVHLNTLYRFLRGGSVHCDTLTKIEAWCDREEHKDGN